MRVNAIGGRHFRASPTRGRLPGGKAKRYGAFISYSHERDTKFAVALQTGVERFGRSWNRARVVRMFRDDANLSANPGLWSSIEEALAASDWFVLLASPESASSRWVNRELEWWLENDLAERILIVLTAGELAWNDEEQDFDREGSTAAPAALRGAFSEEPRYVDAGWSSSDELVSRENPQLRAAIADVAATIRGIPKDELISEAARQQRRTRTIVRSVVAGFPVFFVAVVATALQSSQTRSQSHSEARTSLSRQLAATAENLQASDLDTALLLAVQGYMTEANANTFGALMRANTATAPLTRFVHFGNRISAVTTSVNGDFVAVGLVDGSVHRVPLIESGPTSEPVLTLDKKVSSVAISDGGTAVAASDRERARLWQTAVPEPVELVVPSGEKADAVGLSPDGETAAVEGARGFSSRSVSVFSGRSGETKTVHPVPDERAIESLQLPTEDEIGLYGIGGSWEERRISDWSLLWNRVIGYGARESGGVPSASGEWISATNGADTVPVWSTRGSGDRDPPDLTAEVTLSGFPTALTIDPEGRRLAIAEGGVIYLAPLAPPAANRPGAIALRGGGAVDSDLIRFAGDARHLVSASDEKLAVWDTGQLDRLATVSRLPLGTSCTACGPPQLAVSPDADGEELAVSLDGSAALKTPALIQSLTPGAGAAERLSASGLTSFAAPVWLGGGAAVAFPIEDKDPFSDRPPAVPERARAWTTDAERGIAVTARGADGRSVIVVDGRGQIFVHDGESGDVRARLPGPSGLSGGSGVLTGASVDASGELVARLYAGGLTITELASGEIVGEIPPTGARYARYAGERLLVQRREGTLEVWSRDGSDRERVLPGDRSYAAAPVGSLDGTLVARTRLNGEITIADLRDGATLATLNPPPQADTGKTGIAFGPGRLMLTVSESYPRGAILARRELSGPNLVEVACQAAGRGLTGDEWDRLVSIERPEEFACEQPVGE